MTRLRHRPPAADVRIDVRVEIHGELPRADAEYARVQALALLGHPGAGTHRSARLRLTRTRNRAVGRPVIAQAGLEQDGVGPVRVQLSAVTAREAVDLALGTLLGRAARLREYGDIGLAAAYESAYRPQFAPRPLAERRLVRRKSVTLARRTPEGAVREMLALDHQFHLFADAATGEDCLVHREPGDGGFRLVRANSAVHAGSAVPPVLAGPYPAPRLSPEEAARRLWLTCWPFVFHIGPADGRGRVLYRRYDGHYALLAPATAGPATG
ncbi:sigma 54 modulation/S30EA ribosomal C-terminal domain-containing protein [Kitasatospora sp. NPDC054939]